MAIAHITPTTHAAIGRSEHISLESEAFETRAAPNPARPLVRYALSQGGRSITKAVSILHDHYVSIETHRSAGTETHTIDLRFVDARPVAVRKVAKRCLRAGIVAIVSTALAVALYSLLPDVAQRIGGVWTPIGLGAVTLACFALCFYLTRESLLFVSVHGRARLIVITGRLGTIRRAKQCVADIVAHIKIAHRQFKQTKQSYLRDEMREHSRLREQGLLSERQYDEAKGRILRSHG